MRRASSTRDAAQDGCNEITVCARACAAEPAQRSRIRSTGRGCCGNGTGAKPRYRIVARRKRTRCIPKHVRLRIQPIRVVRNNSAGISTIHPLPLLAISDAGRGNSRCLARSEPDATAAKFGAIHGPEVGSTSIGATVIQSSRQLGDIGRCLNRDVATA